MNFDLSNTRDWRIPGADGVQLSALKVVDGLGRVIWKKYYLVRYDDNMDGARYWTIRYYENGGYGSMTATTVNKGASVALRTNAFARNGYSFGGWNTRPDGRGSSYSDGQTVTPGSDWALYAQWVAAEHTVSFCANGGTGSMPPIKAPYNSWVDIPECGFARTGYAFSEWACETGGEYTIYSDQDRFLMPDGDVVLSAQWAAVGNFILEASRPPGTDYRIEIKENGSGTTRVISNYGNADRDEYESNSINVVDSYSYTISIYAPYDKMTVVNGLINNPLRPEPYAYFDQNTSFPYFWSVEFIGGQLSHLKIKTLKYNVKLDKQGGTGGSDGVSAIYNADMPYAEMPSRANYVFGGYYDQTGGRGNKYYDAAGGSARRWDKKFTDSYSSGVNADELADQAILYAQWQTSYIGVEQTISAKYNGSSAAKSYVYAEITLPCSAEVSAVATHKNGYEYIDGERITLNSYVDAYMINGSETILHDTKTVDVGSHPRGTAIAVRVGWSQLQGKTVDFKVTPLEDGYDGESSLSVRYIRVAGVRDWGSFGGCTDHGERRLSADDYTPHDCPYSGDAGIWTQDAVDNSDPWAGKWVAWMEVDPDSPYSGRPMRRLTYRSSPIASLPYPRRIP